MQFKKQNKVEWTRKVQTGEEEIHRRSMHCMAVLDLLKASKGQLFTALGSQQWRLNLCLCSITHCTARGVAGKEEREVKAKMKKGGGAGAGRQERDCSGAGKGVTKGVGVNLSACITPQQQIVS